MKNVKKLTPNILKKIIAEEKAKLNSRKQAKNLNENQKLIRQIKLIKKIETRQRKVANDFKKLHEARKILKKRLMRKL